MPSVTRSTRRDPRHRDAIAARVTQAVERLLLEGHGYTSLGVQRIADDSGIARSTFYLHFPDKATLLMTIAETATEELFAAGGAWLELGFADPDRLEQTVAGIVEQQRAHAAVIAAVVEVAAYDEEVATFWRERVGGFIDVLAARIEEGQHAGTIPAALEPSTTAAWITWGTERLIAQHVAEHPPGEDARMVRGLSRAIWSTLGQHARQP